MGEICNRVLDFKKRFKGGVSFRVKKHAEVLEGYINPDEKVLYAFPAQKNESFKEVFNTFAVVLTYTVTPDMYNDMEIYKGLIWGKITIDTVKELIILSNLPKSSLDEIETVISNFMMEAKKMYKNEKKRD